MRGKIPFGWMLLLAAATVWLAADVPGVMAGDSHRAEGWEFTMPVRFYGGETFSSTHGSSIDVNDDLGWGFGVGYNLSEKINVDMEFAWSSTSYNAKFVGGSDNEGLTATASGTLDIASTQFNLTYNILAKSITPYVSAGIGWNWVDSNIPSGPQYGSCWWDPWYGYICGTYQNTYSKSAFNYGLGAGVRIEPKENLFIRVGVNDNWQDWGGSVGTPDILSYRLEIGWKF